MASLTFERLKKAIESVGWFRERWFRYLLAGTLLVLIVFGFVFKAVTTYSVWYHGWYNFFRFVHHGAVLVVAILLLVSCFRFRSPDGKDPVQTAGKKKEYAGHPRGLLLRDLGESGRKWLRGILVLLILAGTLGFYNYGRFHGNNYTHWWEIIHYQFGAKYFPELGYDNLYYAFIAADRETGFRFCDRKRVKGKDGVMRIRKSADNWMVRDLASNEIIPVSRAEARIEAIPFLFTARRWKEFKRDFRFYRSREGRWKRLLVDHGYNPSPVWTVTGRFVTGVLGGLGFGPKGAATVMSHLDPVLLFVMFVLIWRAFGFEMMALAVALWGANPLVMFDYTGGAFLRQDWLVALVSGISLVRIGRPLIGGGLTAYAAATRIFPGAFFLFPAFALVRRLIRREKPEMGVVRFLGGGAAASILLFGLSLQFAGGFGSWKTFIGNAIEHNKGVYTNHVAYRNLFVYEIGRNAKFFSRYGNHYHEKWRQHKEKRVRQLAPLYYGTILLFGAVFFFVMRRRPWEEGVWASGFLVYLVFYPANYYYMFLLPMVFFSCGDVRLGGTLFLTMLFGFFGKRFIRGYDVYHIYLSLLVLLGFAWLLYAVWRDSRPAKAVEAGNVRKQE